MGAYVRLVERVEQEEEGQKGKQEKIKLEEGSLV